MTTASCTPSRTPAGTAAMNCCLAGRSTSQNVIICPYHAWTYSLNGDLRAAAGFKSQRGFRTSQWGLTELPCAEWHGLIFVDGSGKAAAARSRRSARWTSCSRRTR